MAADSRLSIASQFFLEDEAGPVEAVSTSDKVVDLLNQASLMPKDVQKINTLKQVQELIVQKDPALLDNFLDEMLAFQQDKSADVRKFVVGFIEEACKQDPELLTKVVANLNMLLEDENVNVVKKVILSTTQIYRVGLSWLSKVRTISEEMESTWDMIVTMKNRILVMLDSENDGVRTHVVKFLEMMIVVLSARTPDSDIPKKTENDISLDQVPKGHPVIRYNELRDEGTKILDMLLDFTASAHISSMNLMASMGSLTAIAKQRPLYMARVVQAFESLHVNLPPTLAKSQVSSVRKNLKLQLSTLLKHPSSAEFHSQITTLLLDLGATQQELQRIIPKPSKAEKRERSEGGETSQPSKKPKVQDEEEDKVEEKPPPKLAPVTTQTANDITAKYLIPLLSNDNVANIVLLSMVTLPDTMPAGFQSTYTPIQSAGTEEQVGHLARLMAAQMTAAGIGPGVEEMQKQAATSSKKDVEEEGSEHRGKQSIQTVVGGTTALEKKKPAPLQPQLQQQKSRRIKGFRLADTLKPLSDDENQGMVKAALKRILDAERTAIAGGVSQERMKILSSLVVNFGDNLMDIVQDFILEDVRGRVELGFACLYKMHAETIGKGKDPSALQRYEQCMVRMLSGICNRPDQRDGLFHQVVAGAPYITDGAVNIIRNFCLDENHVYIGMSTLRDLIISRPSQQLLFLQVLLDLTQSEKLEVRSNSIRFVKLLHTKPKLQEAIESFALTCLKCLVNKAPPPRLVIGKPAAEAEWTEDLIKLCLHLYLALLPLNHKLIHELASVYVAASANIKRVVLRVLESPVKGMGMASPELLLLVENCPRGAETLVTRMLHVLTDKAPPSPELVRRVRDLYHKRVPDVRFLIPVLNGLEKKEVVAALPKLIKLNPIVVKEVFNRLLGTQHAGDGNAGQSPLTPGELLVALHNVDTAKCDMKSIIKATGLCFAEKQVYTSEVLAVVMQQLMEQNPLPTLLMRTVIQSLSMYPRLLGFVMNILQRLIIKQVWKQPKVWEGFIKCCQRTKPQSFQVLLQLPPPQLKNVFEKCPDLRAPLLEQIGSFTPHQRAHIPRAVMVVLEAEPSAEELKVAQAKAQAQADKAAQEKANQEKAAAEQQKQKEAAAQKAAAEQQAAPKPPEIQKPPPPKPAATPAAPKPPEAAKSTPPPPAAKATPPPAFQGMAISTVIGGVRTPPTSVSGRTGTPTGTPNRTGTPTGTPVRPPASTASSAPRQSGMSRPAVAGGRSQAASKPPGAPLVKQAPAAAQQKPKPAAPSAQPKPTAGASKPVPSPAPAAAKPAAQSAAKPAAATPAASSADAAKPEAKQPVQVKQEPAQVKPEPAQVKQEPDQTPASPKPPQAEQMEVDQPVKEEKMETDQEEQKPEEASGSRRRSARIKAQH
ncbi:PREDICTED: symplekin-like isoform X3 [Branchiostoma belcheri]|uniref:Symplekin-like isoform X3 n=1 Tax=Branchiostoma belcheri TaxID=7741 RepID=A0A6P4YE46_BRABE|nr:PREDICTED: symplekin-like isoform X3 [Branchiostoma belcheri]